MNKKMLLIVVTISFLVAGSTILTTPRMNISIPTQLRAAADAYKKNGVEAFLPTLFNSQLASGNGVNVREKIAVMKTVEKAYGRYVGLEMIDSIRISKSTKIIFFVLKYQKGPLYGVITTYRFNKSTKITGFKIHTVITQIIPTQILARYITR